jgi:hypothetical protein
MAVNYSNYPQYTAAVSKVQELELRLNGAPGSRATGLAQAMDNVANSKGETSPEYVALKAEFDKVQADLATAKANAAAMRAEIDKSVADKDKAKNAAKQKETDAANVKQLTLERDSAKRQNDDATAAAKQKQIDAITNPTKKDPLNPIDPVTGTDWSQYAIDAKGNVTHGNKQVVFVSTTDAKGNVQPTEFSNMSDARSAFLKGYSSPEALKSLQESLINKHYITSAQVADGTWISGVDTLITGYTTKVVSDKLYNTTAKSINTNEFLASTASLGGASTPRQYKTITTRGDAKKELDEYLIDLRGSASTPQEEDAYYTQLHAAEQKAVRTVSGGTTTGSELAQPDHVLIAANVAKKSLAGTDVDKLLQSGGRAATDIAALQQYASSYGVQMSAADALKYVAAGLGQQDYLKKQEERIKQTSIALHPQLKDHILAGGTVADIADQYAYAKKQKLGVAVPVSTADKDVMDAVTKGISISDFNTQLQSRPEWRKTAEAHNAVDNFINNIAQTWGLG